MPPEKNFTKVISLLVGYSLTIFVIFKLQNDNTIVKTELKLKENNLEFVKNDYSKNRFRFSNVDKTTKIVNFTLNSSKTKSIRIIQIRDTTNCVLSRPNFPDLQFDNIYWQTLNTINVTFKLFRAFYDDRKESKLAPVIRLIAMINGTEPKNIYTYCQFWFDKFEKPMISNAIQYQLIWYKIWGFTGNYLPYLITCRYNFNKYKKIPNGVSLVHQKCDQAKNYLKILNNRLELAARKKTFAVCVKALIFEDESMAIRFVEWIELLRILGADKIFIYQFHVSKNIRKVYDYYERYGILEVIKLYYPKNLPTHRWPNEVISLNDCFYRNMYLYDYIAILDIDEVIIPTHPDDMSWLDLLHRIKQNEPKNKTYASYNFRNIYFLDELQHTNDWNSEIPHYLHILRHLIRPVNHTAPGYTIKSFLNTNVVKTVHNHFPITCFNGLCNDLDVNTDFGHLAHYRRICPPDIKEACKYYRNHTVEDKTVWKYKDELIKQVTKAVNMLELLKEN